ncbi:MAG: hypothetical protein WB735_21975 [Pseudonocardiaceae bacterium]
MQVVRTIAGAAPTPKQVGALERWRVAWHGRRDAQYPSESGQPHPYLEALRAHAEVGQRSVSEWLHGKIDPIDREAVQVLILLDQHRRDPMIAPESTATKPEADEGDPQPQSSIPPRVLKAREAVSAQKAYRRWLREQEQAEQRLGELGSIRHHLIEAARAAAHAQLARYQHLVGLYNTAVLRRDPDRHSTGTAPAVSPEPWLYGDMPLVCLEIDVALAEKYRWRLKDFASQTSAVTVPVGDVAPNRN